MSRLAVGVDIGGTTIKLGLVAPDGQVRARHRLPYGTLRSFEDVADSLADAVRRMEAQAGRAAVLGIAAPGHAQPGDGVMVDGTRNVPLLKDRSLAEALTARLALPFVTVNDGSAAALGELHFGAGRGLARFALITLGTGVGGGVVIARRLVTGDDGVPPELGAMVLDDRQGAPRTLEDFASASGFIAAYEDRGGAPGCEPADIFARAAAGDAAAGAALDAVCRRIAQGLGTLINALNLDACLIGGGIAQAGAPLLERVHHHLPDFTWQFLLARTRVTLAATGEDAGILGAARLALERTAHSP
ncbi:ROK family protein [Vineibacter terrae]|uniref:ROK family protein n=1 Tax=Vineibacter terrae TaxID=2586908 RepID=UPI002E304F0B|nr:ROK family protein [Vineibacter terrae]HEX2885435.1 ROK family protein [Vineibacter terrae]